MGAVSLSSRDLMAWQEEQGIGLSPWEARTIRRLSREYAAESHRAEAADAAAPWQPELTEDRRAKVARHVRNVLRG